MLRIPIADIRRLTIHDGPGTRTTVFVKGCPLRCLWCHNPETVSGKPVLLFRENLCVDCRKCVSACRNKVHVFGEDGHSLDRAACSLCGRCVEACLANALEICGTYRTPDELLPLLLKDRMFYASGGGVTFSGGEPMLYPDFVAEVFSALGREHVHTALDTCGCVPFESFEKVLPFTDLVLFDLKGMDDERHIRNTGRSNALIHENLRRLGSHGVLLEIRMPVIPGYNDGEQEFHSAGRLLQEIPSLKAVRLLPYHSLAREKYNAAGIMDTMPHVPAPDKDAMAARADILKQYTAAEVIFS